MGKETEKGIGKLKIGLSMSLIVIVILALLNSWFYITKQSLELTHNDYMVTHSHTDTEYAALQSEYNDYMATHSHNDSEFNALQSEYNDYMATHGYTNDEFWDLSANYTYEHWYHHYYENQTLALKAPKLSALSVYGKDVRELWDKYLHITGEVWNVGTDTAYNSWLRVMAYQGDVPVINTSISLGTIEGESRKLLDCKISYLGDPITFYMWCVWD